MKTLWMAPLLFTAYALVPAGELYAHGGHPPAASLGEHLAYHWEMGEAKKEKRRGAESHAESAVFEALAEF